MAVGIIAAIGLQKIWTGLPKEWGVMTVFTYWGGEHSAAVSIDYIVFNEVMTKKKAA